MASTTAGSPHSAMVGPPVEGQERSKIEDVEGQKRLKARRGGPDA
jgi:hypothetical protein